MKATGIVRKVDHLGRIVIPRELRRTLGIEDGTPLEIYTDNHSVTLKKHTRGCEFCGSAIDNLLIHDKRICKECAQKIARLI